MKVLKFIRDILPGEFIDHSRIVVVERQWDGVALHLEGGRRLNLAGDHSVAEVHSSSQATPEELAAIRQQLAKEYEEGHRWLLD